MFDLNDTIANWRQELAASGVDSVETLDELESHLRETFERLVQSGVQRQEAFQLAAEQLGRGTDLAVEFRKVEPTGWLPLKLKAATGVILVVLTCLSLLLSGRVRNGGMELLLACHVLAITIGYVSAMAVGGLGICYVCERWVKGISLGRISPLSQATFMFTSFSAILTLIGIVLGALWAKAHLGRYWGWDAKEIGGLAVLSWLALELGLQQSKVGHACDDDVEHWRKYCGRAGVVWGEFTDQRSQQLWSHRLSAGFVRGPERHFLSHRLSACWNTASKGALILE